MLHDFKRQEDQEALTPSSEHYIRAIRNLRKEEGYARTIDIARYLGVAPATVTLAVRKLEAQHFVQRDNSKFFSLTPEGERLAASVSGRYQTVLTFLRDILGVDAATAELDACRIEHVISNESTNRLIDMIEFFKSRSPLNDDVRASFAGFKRECAAVEESCDDCQFECSAIFHACKH